ncbi:MAG: ABC transporter permease subunit [Gemmatimonadota bacterium]|nr:ABC transporter permease subunit [Gemmatimonadota bacterium]
MSALASEMGRHRGSRSGLGLLAAALVAAPVVVGIAYSVLGALGVVGPGADGISLRHIMAVLANSATWRGLLWTLWIALASTLAATILAMTAAAVFRAERGVDRFARVVAVLPLAVPHVVAALCGLLVLSQSGLLARLAFAANLQVSPADMPALTHDRYGVGLILSLTWKEFPFLALIAFSVIARAGAAMEETARSLGAGALQTFQVAVLPNLWRGLLPSMTAVFAFVAGNFEAAALLAPSSPLALPLLTMERFTDSALSVRPEAFALVLLGMAVSLCGVAAHEWAAHKAKA